MHAEICNKSGWRYMQGCQIMIRSSVLVVVSQIRISKLFTNKKENTKFKAKMLVEVIEVIVLII